MTTITIKQHKDPVWFLGGDGFHKGWVNSILVSSNRHNKLEIKYYVVHSGDNPEFMGRECSPDQVFDSGAEMLNYYSSKI